MYIIVILSKQHDLFIGCKSNWCLCSLHSSFLESRLVQRLNMATADAEMYHWQSKFAFCFEFVWVECGYTVNLFCKITMILLI